MENHTVKRIETVIDYIENHLDARLDLESVAQAVHYSKYYLHRMFVQTTGLTVHDYIQRRQLTEAAKLLLFSDKPIIEIALLCGYESQQAFSSAFKSMYKEPPARYRENCVFYPLQLRFRLCRNAMNTAYTKDDIALAESEDLPAWMELMRLVIDGYPAMDETAYSEAIVRCIDEKRALVLRGENGLIGAMTYSERSGSIEFLGVHPQYRRCGIQRLFLDALMETYLPGQEISMTTYRAGDKADTGHRELLRELGFAERELLVEFGYPTQRFALDPKKEGECAK
ncbi:MAG: helix-turn-helix domain-containing protein [Clostridia bacterium]|nr:helix-turn-helix domain-containing protein [Clostridia bacterium]